MVKRFLFQIHLWVGLILCLPLVMLGLTGSILVFHDDLLEWELSPPRVGAGEARPMSEVIAAAKAARPQAGEPFLAVFPEAPGLPAVVRYNIRVPAATPGGAPGSRPLMVYVDPVTLAVLGDREPMTTVTRWIARLHGNLLMRDQVGRDLIGWLGVAMLALGISGLVLWWPRRGRWVQALTMKRGARGLRLHRDLHGVVGIWGWAVFMAVSLTGVYLAFPKPVAGAILSVFPGKDVRGAGGPGRVQPIQGEQPMDVDAAIALARATIPDARLRGVSLPLRPDQPYRMGMLVPNYGRGAPFITIWIDPWQKRVLQFQDPRRYNTGETIIAWQHAVHAGDGLGPVYTAVVFLSGLTPALFAVTGVAMWWIKRRARPIRPVPSAVPQPN